jgi:hypothetical protein
MTRQELIQELTTKVRGMNTDIIAVLSTILSLLYQKHNITSQQIDTLLLGLIQERDRVVMCEMLEHVKQIRAEEWKTFNESDPVIISICTDLNILEKGTKFAFQLKGSTFPVLYDTFDEAKDDGFKFLARLKRDLAP